VTSQDAPGTPEQFGTTPPNTYGWILECKRDADGKVIFGKDATGNYFVFERDLQTVSDQLIVGYKYRFIVSFPEQYFKSKEGNSDYTSFLNVARLKFAVGLTGAVEFQLKTKGRDIWNQVFPVIEADYYSANTGPLKNRYFFTIPIHQRSTNFMLKAYSDVPFPVCINMMTWEGMYSPRFYKRT
jgi:hypothetical protein